MVKRYDLTMCYFASGAGVPDMEESEHGDYVEHGDYAALAERCERLEGALRELADANFAEFCGVGTEAFESDDSKVSYPEDRCNITFGMIRRAIYLLSGSSGGKDG